MAERVPPRFVVHADPRRRGRWNVHEKGSLYCGATNPNWAGHGESGCLGLSTPSYENAIEEAHQRASEKRIRFFRDMQQRGKSFNG